MPSERLRRPVLVLALVLAGGCGTDGPTDEPAPAPTEALPDTSSGVHLAEPFVRCYREVWTGGQNDSRGCRRSTRRSIRVLDRAPVDIGWMWTHGYWSPRRLGLKARLGAALQFDRFPAWDVSHDRPAARPLTLRRWQRTHPDWIVYRCDRKRPAWEFGDVPRNADSPAYVPMDISNPEVREHFFARFVRPALDDGFPLVFLDNVSVANAFGRCGRRTAEGAWEPLYDETPQGRARLVEDVVGWLTYLRDAIHAHRPGALLAVNYNPVQDDDPPEVRQRLLDAVDVVWEEGAFTLFGERRQTTADSWEEEVAVLRDLAERPDKALIVGVIVGATPDEAKAAPERLTYEKVEAPDLEWAMANYLLVKGARTYLSLKTGDYGYHFPFKIARVPVGEPEAPMERYGAVAVRRYANGFAAVNPDPSAPARVRLPAGRFRTVSGRSARGSITLRPASGAVLTQAR